MFVQKILSILVNKNEEKQTICLSLERKKYEMLGFEKKNLYTFCTTKKLYYLSYQHMFYIMYTTFIQRFVESSNTSNVTQVEETHSIEWKEMELRNILENRSIAPGSKCIGWMKKEFIQHEIILLD